MIKSNINLFFGEYVSLSQLCVLLSLYVLVSLSQLSVLQKRADQIVFWLLIKKTEN